MADQSELIPVEAIDDFFVVSADWLVSDVPFPSSKERERLLGRGYVQRSGIVHIEGHSRRAVILAPPDGADQFFAVLEASPKPDAVDVEAVSEDERSAFWSKLNERFGRSEGVLPEQCSEIATSFIEPRLALPHADGEHVAWGMLRDNSYLLVSGAPGSGKTTLLREWLLWHAERRRNGESNMLPLCLPLRNYVPADSIETALRREAEACAAPWLARDLKAYARRGQLAVAFDGVDEIPEEDRAAALIRLKEFTNSYPDCRFLVTTRPGVRVPFEVGLLRVDLLPFDAARQRQLVYYKLHASGTWKSFSSRVEAEPALEWIVGNPLALSLLVARYLRREIKPWLVSQIVGAVVEMFVDTWDASRGIVRSRERALSPAAKRKLLAWVAENRNASVHEEMPLLESLDEGARSDVLLALVSEHTGLLRCEQSGSWVFKNGTLEDYFRATLWVSALASKASEFKRLLRRPLTAARSQLARFVGFMSSDADAQIEDVLRKLETPEFATAVRLTEVLSQGIPLRRATLELYARLVSDVLEEPLRGARLISAVRSERKPFCLRVMYSSSLGTHADDLSALLAALHRSRDGIGAEAIRAFVHESSSHRLAIEGLLNADGELHLERTAESMTWTVAEILPNIPSGPTGDRTAARVLH